MANAKAILGCLFAISGLVLSCPAFAAQRILLIPLDDRPATTQFPQMIGGLADVVVETPPDSLLGHFTQPGSPEKILDWCKDHLKFYDIVIANIDMIAYGGLIASRTDRSTLNLAQQRITRFAALRKSVPQVKFYGFSTIMRLAPTATKESKSWRMDLARFAELKDKYSIGADPKILASLNNLRKRIPEGQIERYYSVRSRNNAIQLELVKQTSEGIFDFLAFGQDDAKPNGPHVGETRKLKNSTKALSITSQIQFTEGIDQLGSLLVSRSLLDSIHWTPKIRVVYADQAGRQKVAFYESETIDNSLRDQIIGSGAQFAGPNETFDYSLYVNTPDPRVFALDAFLKSLKSEVDQGFPVAIADINLGSSGTADPRLFDAVTSQGRSSRILAYAGWNTAGNTMGTTIPAANAYMLSRKQGSDPLQREIALRTFILHRLVNDFEYHKYVRPEAYAMIDKFPNSSREETYGNEFEKVSNLVKKDLGERLQIRFQEQLFGTHFFAGSKEYEITGLDDVSISLPWPRAYEVKLSFKIQAALATSKSIDFSKIPILPLSPQDGKRVDRR